MNNKYYFAELVPSKLTFYYPKAKLQYWFEPFLCISAVGEPFIKDVLANKKPSFFW
ncbi:hypothetical protein NLX69_16590 [Rossellomorea sp. BNER]|nr:hypothetical protein [Rossellomorea sp. BNER]